MRRRTGFRRRSDTAVSTANFSGVFAIASQAFGADGPGTAPVLGYALSLIGCERRGLRRSTATARASSCTTIGGVITGSTRDGGRRWTTGNTIFTIAVNGSGVVTLTQFAEIDHANNGDTSAPYDDQFAVLGTNLVRLTASATITDGDGDTRDRQRVHRPWRQYPFADDGPSIDVTATNEAGRCPDDAGCGDDGFRRRATRRCRRRTSPACLRSAARRLVRTVRARRRRSAMR